jgi:hypothetical protein
MVRDPRARSFGLLWVVLFAMGSVVALGPCTMLFEFGSDPGPGKRHQPLSLLLVWWAVAEIAVTPFVIGRNLDRVVFPTGWKAGFFYGGIALLLGGMTMIGLTFGSPPFPSESPWPFVVAGTIQIIVGSQLARRGLLRRTDNVPSA